MNFHEEGQSLLMTTFINLENVWGQVSPSTTYLQKCSLLYIKHKSFWSRLVLILCLIDLIGITLGTPYRLSHIIPKLIRQKCEKNKHKNTKLFRCYRTALYLVEHSQFRCLWRVLSDASINLCCRHNTRFTNIFFFHY